MENKYRSGYRRKLRSQSSRELCSGPSPSIGSSVASTVTTADETNCTEIWAFHAQTTRRRRATVSKSQISDLHHRRNQSKLEGQTNKNGESVEYSLEELHSMNEFELGYIMCKAGLSSEDISSINGARNMHDNVEPLAEVKRKKMMVAFFVNSGHVKLVAGNSRVARYPTLPSLESDSVVDSFPTPVVSVDASSVKSSDSKGLSRKSEVEEIANLKMENSKVKMENKSLKKTLKKLSFQLKNVISENEELRKTLKEAVKGRSQKDSSSDLLKSKESIEYLKRKYKKETEARAMTESQMKAEIETLTKEVGGLQRELACSLESLEDAKKCARNREPPESTSNLQQELLKASTKVKELTTEAKARDKLIETFSKVLLEKISSEGEGGGGGQNLEGCEVFEEEEKLGDGVVMDLTEENLFSHCYPEFSC